MQDSNALDVAGDMGENLGYGQGIDYMVSQIVKVLGDDQTTLAGLLRMSNLSRQEQEDRLKQIEVGLRHGIPQIVWRGIHAIAGSPGRDGHRADQIVAIGSRNAGYFSYAERRGTAGLFSGIGRMLSRRSRDDGANVPPEMRT